MPTRNDAEAPFDPAAPCIGSDGLEYEDFAARLTGQPLRSWRNEHILSARALGRSEEAIRIWIEAYDKGGSDQYEDKLQKSKRLVRANFAADPKYGRSIINPVYG